MSALFFNAIDRTLPNPTLDNGNNLWIVRRVADELASIIVAFPLFLFITRWIVRSVQNRPERLNSIVRNWLTYIALVITASIVIGDVVTFLAYLLRGDLDTRFVLKVVAVVVIAAGVFTYYLDSLQHNRVSGWNRWFAIAAAAVVIFGISVGFVPIGSPGTQRSLSEDTRRLADLSTLAQKLHGSWEAARGRKEFLLPATIQEFSVSGLGQETTIFDPVSGEAYGYKPLHGTAYNFVAHSQA